MDGQNCPTSNRCKVNFGVYFSGARHHVIDAKPTFALAFKAFAAAIFNGNAELVFGGFSR